MKTVNHSVRVRSYYCGGSGYYMIYIYYCYRSVEKGMGKKGNTGGKPHTVGQCTNCGDVYPVRETENEKLRPIRTDGICTSCGHDGFAPVQDT